MLFKILRTSKRGFSIINSLSRINETKTCTTHQDQMSDTAGVSLGVVVARLNAYAPPSLAESWDNVGLLLEPYSKRLITKILLTNDLTEPVMEEAIRLNAAMIISYHPPIFAAFKSITRSKWKDRIVAACLENKIALYSPHTCFDAIKGGVNDWLASAFDSKCVSPITFCTKSSTADGNLVKLKFEAPEGRNIGDICSQLKDVADGENAELRHVETRPSGDAEITFTCSNQLLPKVVDIFKVSKLDQVSRAEEGMGRICELKAPQKVQDLVDQIKQHLQLPHVRLALAVGKDKDSLVSTVAVCAGSGASVFRGVKADLYLTGEMSHHEVLDAVHNGRHVVLCEHSNTERGFLKVFARTLAQDLLEGQVEVVVSSCDADPLTVV